MRIIADCKVLRTCLDSLSKIPYTASTGYGDTSTAQAESFLITFDETKLSVFVDDGSIAIASSIPVSDKMQITGSGQFAIKANTLNELVKSFDQNIEFSFPEKNVVCLNSGTSKNQINLVATEAWTKFPVSESGIEITLTAEQIQAINNQVAFAADRQEGRAIYQGINLRTKNDSLSITATDNQRIAHKNIPIATATKIDATIPVRSFSEIYRQTLEEPTNTKVVFVFEETQLSIRPNPNKQIVCKLLHENYPDIDQHLALQPITTVLCDRKKLTQALNRIAIVCDRQLLPSAKITASENQLSIASPKNMETGFSEEIIDAQVNGPAQSASLRIKFLTQAISCFASERIQIAFSADEGAIIIQGEGQTDVTHLVLPFWDH